MRAPGCGRMGHPAFSTPSVLRTASFWRNLRRMAPRHSKIAPVLNAAVCVEADAGSETALLTSYLGDCGAAVFLTPTVGLTVGAGGFIAAACAGRYLATIAGSSEAIALSGSRYQVSFLPSSEMPQ